MIVFIKTNWLLRDGDRETARSERRERETVNDCLSLCVNSAYLMSGHANKSAQSVNRRRRATTRSITCLASVESDRPVVQT